MNGPDDYIADTVNFEDGDDHWFTQEEAYSMFRELQFLLKASPEGPKSEN